MFFAIAHQINVANRSNVTLHWKAEDKVKRNNILSLCTMPSAKKTFVCMENFNEHEVESYESDACE